MRTSFRDITDWFTIWLEDKRSILATMMRNLQSDIDAGYSPDGNSVRKQGEEILAYQSKFESEMDRFEEMTADEVNHWCYRDLLRRGAIG